MSRTRHVLPALVTAAALAIFAGDTLAQTLSADEKELAAYRLTLPTVKKLAAVMQSLAEEAAQDPKAKEIAGIRAEIKELQKKDELTEAEGAKLEKLLEREQALEDEEDITSNPRRNAETLAEMEAQIKRFPSAVRALAREGLTAREYARATMALLQAAMVESFSQGKADLAKLPPGVNPENVRFVRENKTELEALQSARAGKPKK